MTLGETTYFGTRLAHFDAPRLVTTLTELAAVVNPIAGSKQSITNCFINHAWSNLQSQYWFLNYHPFHNGKFKRNSSTQDTSNVGHLVH